MPASLIDRGSHSCSPTSPGNYPTSSLAILVHPPRGRWDSVSCVKRVLVSQRRQAGAANIQQRLVVVGRAKVSVALDAGLVVEETRGVCQECLSLVGGNLRGIRGAKLERWKSVMRRNRSHIARAKESK